MKVILESENISKINAVKIAFEKLNIFEYKIDSFFSESFVSSKPINQDILQGALNRNNNLKKYFKENNIDFDLLISIE